MFIENKMGNCVLNRTDYYDDSVSGRIHHPSYLRFENGCLKAFKQGQSALGSQNLIIIGSIDDYQLCLNISSSENPNTVIKLGRENQIMRLTKQQTEEIYRKPRNNTYVRLDWVYLFKNICGGFDVVSFINDLLAAFDRVSHLMVINPMNLKREEISELPKLLVNLICKESKAAIFKTHGITIGE